MKASSTLYFILLLLSACLPQVVLTFHVPPASRLRHTSCNIIISSKNNDDSEGSSKRSKSDKGKEWPPHPFSQLLADILPTTTKSNLPTIPKQRQKINNTDITISALTPSSPPAEIKHLLSKYQNRATILQNELIKSRSDLTTQKRRVVILQDIVLRLKSRSSTLEDSLNTLTNDWRLYNMTVKEERRREKEDFINQERRIVDDLEKKAREWETKAQEAGRECDEMKQRIQSQERESREILAEEQQKRAVLERDIKKLSSELYLLQKQRENERQRLQREISESIQNKTCTNQSTTPSPPPKNEQKQNQTESILIAQASVKASLAREKKLSLQITTLTNELHTLRAAQSSWDNDRHQLLNDTSFRIGELEDCLARTRDELRGREEDAVTESERWEVERNGMMERWDVERKMMMEQWDVERKKEREGYERQLKVLRREQQRWENDTRKKEVVDGDKFLPQHAMKGKKEEEGIIEVRRGAVMMVPKTVPPKTKRRLSFLKNIWFPRRWFRRVD